MARQYKFAVNVKGFEGRRVNLAHPFFVGKEIL